MKAFSARRARTAAAVAIVTTWCSAAQADQFVVLDETWDHTADLPDSHFVADSTAQTPADWTSPVDYRGGTAWVYLEVFTKPTAQETRFQACLLGSPTYACTLQSPTYTQTGTYEWATDFDQFWSPPGETVDWSQGVGKLSCILKDTMNGKPSADNVGRETAALYMPTHVRMVVTVVAPGSTYVPPEPTGAGGEGGAGGGGGGAGGAGAATSSSAASTSSSSGPESASSASTGSSSSAASGVGGAAGDDDESGGCAIRSSGKGSAVAMALFAAAAILAGRRRRR